VQYIAHLENKSKKLKELNQRIRSELIEKESEFERCQVEKSSLQAQVDAQSISPADVDRMTAEREKLVSGLEQMASKLDEARKVTFERELTAQKKVETLEKLIQGYNTLGYRIGIIPATAPYAAGEQYEIDFNVQVATQETGGVRPDQLINRDLRHEIRAELSKLRERLAGEVHKKQDEAILLQEQLDRIYENLVDKKDELEGLEAKVAASMEQFSEIKDVRPRSMVS
jgi:kinetochore protein NDC80